MKHSRRSILKVFVAAGSASIVGCSDDASKNEAGAGSDAGSNPDATSGSDAKSDSSNTTPDAGQDASVVTPLVFDYYISTTGSDSNPGSLESPWAITGLVTKKELYSGKTVGLLDGVYDVSALMPSGGSTYYTAAFDVDGGTPSSPTIIAAVQPRQAMLDAKGASGTYGGSETTQASILRHGAGEAHQGHLVLDGIRFTGFKTGAIQIGTYASSSAVAGIVIRNCEFFDGSGIGAPTDNFFALELNECVGAVVQNNYFHDLTGWTASSNDHLSALLVWHSRGTIIEYNTCVNASNIYGKEAANEGTIIRFNFVKQIDRATGAVSDWCGAPGSLTQTTEIHSNVLVSDHVGIGLLATLGGGGWVTPLRVYNNTIVIEASGINQSHFAAFATGDAKIEWFNNVLVGSLSPDRKMICANARAWSKCAFNVYPATGTRWRILDEDTGDPDSAASDHATVSGYRAAVEAAGGLPQASMELGVVETSQSSAALFVGSGEQAAYYMLAPGSAAKLAGKSDGTSDGAPCDAGAWGGANPPTRVGCDFA